MAFESFQADPDQVLVLYNADWEKDVDGSSPGQDSKEVAEYYVDRHTDPVSGKKPYLLGLSCVHNRKHLNQWVIKEKSQDNRNGVLFRGKGLAPGKKEWARDSRHVEIVVKGKQGRMDWDSARMWCSSLIAKEKKEVIPIVSGIPLRKGRKWAYPEIENGKGRCFRLNAREIFPGTVWIYFEVKDKQGHKVRNLRLKYYDRDDFVFSMAGPDRISDEKNFQEDVAIPVKQFLEDRKNCLPDGTFLKDHILYIVLCHGLPFSCEGVFGIERGGDIKYFGSRGPRISGTAAADVILWLGKTDHCTCSFHVHEWRAGCQNWGAQLQDHQCSPVSAVRKALECLHASGHLQFFGG